MEARPKAQTKCAEMVRTRMSTTESQCTGETNEQEAYKVRKKAQNSGKKLEANT